MRQDEVREALRCRADRYLNETRLVVDYYRIRRRVAFPWPMDALPDVGFAVPHESYPWHIWLAWVVEERLNSLGWAGHVLGDERLRERARQELAAVARWPTHSTSAGPDLVLGHLLRTLLGAARDWEWLGPDVGRAITAACGRAIEHKRAWLDENLSSLRDAGQVLSLPSPQRERATQNIPVIGTIALAMAADAAAHAAAPALRQRADALVRARFDLLAQGVTEAVAYDGYVLDFVADALAARPADQREPILGHPSVERILRMGIDLAAPGDAIRVAELGDVEPWEMPFHVSAHAKLARLRPIPSSVWYLRRCRADWLRADALAAIHELPDEPAAPAPPASGTAVGPYAVTLRTGWDAGDVAVVIGAPRSPMGHIHFDAGSILIGHRGAWLIADPGYQQYLQKREREFTLGPRAHNAPVINGHPQTVKAAEVIDAGNAGGGVRRAVIDMARCYAPEAKIARVRRSVWLLPTGIVAVCDDVEGNSSVAPRLEYAWHGPPDASWWAEDGKAVVCHEGTELWIASSAAKISHARIDRVPGSRGHLTLLAEAPARDVAARCWWIFNLGTRPAHFESDGLVLKVDGVELHAGGMS